MGYSRVSLIDLKFIIGSIIFVSRVHVYRTPSLRKPTPIIV